MPVYVSWARIQCDTNTGGRTWIYSAALPLPLPMRKTNDFHLCMNKVKEYQQAETECGKEKNTRTQTKA